MRPVSLCLLVLVATCLLAQAPIGMGPGGKVDVFDWWTGTASGCTAGAGEMCVGPNYPHGDTYYFTGWLANAANLPVTTGLPIVGTFNDGQSVTCGNNLAVFQLAAFDWSNRNASKIVEVNCMTSYSPGSNAPVGWYGHCANGDNASLGNVCGWKSRTPLALDGCLYLPVERQIGTGSPSVHDSTLIKSCDGGHTWKNPYTAAHGGAASATGDAPLCGAVDGNAGSACLDPTYAGSIMWPAMPSTVNGTGIYNWMFLQYGQDGALPSGIGGDCDPATWVCAILNDGSIGRVLRTDFPSLDVTKWSYTASTDANHVPTWTSIFAARKPVATFASSGNDIGRPLGILSGPTYIKEFKSYLLTGFDYSPDRVVFMASPSPFGPWKMAGLMPGFIGFNSIALGVGYSVVSTNPPHVQVTVVADYKGHPDGTASWGVPTFSKYDIVLGVQPYGNGDVPSYMDTGLGRINSGWQFTAGDVPGTFNRNGLVWAFDFMDHGGITSSGYPFFHDVANNAAIMYPCFTDGATGCGQMVKGAVLLSNGVQLQAGYAPRLESNISDLNTGAAGGNQNAPGAMQGNGSYSVAGVFQFGSGAFNEQSPLWYTGDTVSDNTKVGLYFNAISGDHLALSWIGRWFTAPSFTMTAGNWYFIAATVQANGSTPTAHLWTGASGTLTDIIAGVARSGAGTATPNVSASPLRMMPVRGSVSYAGLMVYNRALSYLDCASLYQSFKAKMAERGVTVQ